MDSAFQDMMARARAKTRETKEAARMTDAADAEAGRKGPLMSIPVAAVGAGTDGQAEAPAASMEPAGSSGLTTIAASGDRRLVL